MELRIIYSAIEVDGRNVFTVNIEQLIYTIRADDYHVDCTIVLHRKRLRGGALEVGAKYDLYTKDRGSVEKAP